MLSSDFTTRSICPVCLSGNRRLAQSSGVDDAVVADNISSAFSGYETWNHFFDFFRCEDCDLLYSTCYPTDGLLNELYREVAKNEVGQDGPALDATHSWLARKFVAPELSDGRTGLRVLELGPDTGRFAAALSRCVSSVHIDFVEPNVTAWEDLRRRFGDDVLVAASLAELGQRLHYDVIIAHHVFDHVPDVSGLMRALNTLTTGGSTLSIVVHNHRSMLRRLMRSKWPPFCLQHPHIFSRRSLRQLLEGCGWDVRVVRRQVNYVGILATLNNLLRVFTGKHRGIPRRDVVVPVRFGNIGVIAQRRTG